MSKDTNHHRFSQPNKEISKHYQDQLNLKLRKKQIQSVDPIDDDFDLFFLLVEWDDFVFETKSKWSLMMKWLVLLKSYWNECHWRRFIWNKRWWCRRYMWMLFCLTRRIQENKKKRKYKRKEKKRKEDDDDVYFFFDLFVLVKLGLISW